MQHLAVLGSTGSIGRQTLEIVRLFPDRLRVHALSANNNLALLAEQIREFNPEIVAVGNGSRIEALRELVNMPSLRVLGGPDGLCEMVSESKVDTVVTAVVGAVGLRPTIAAIEAGKKIALANKETMVIAGEFISELARSSAVRIVPVDSEHSALYQCLVGEDVTRVEQLILTASGGPFRDRPLETFGDITREQALNHPNWDMGEKITIDSATMMNKGLEVIEARWLFDIEPDRIKVVIHPQSIIHSMVTFSDGSTKAQLGTPDMRIPIQYALSAPDRWEAPHARPRWSDLGSLDFEAPDTERFPSLSLAYAALDRGGVATAALNAANEQAVALFLSDSIGFTDIPVIVERVLEECESISSPSVEDLICTDEWARSRTQELIVARIH